MQQTREANESSHKLCELNLTPACITQVLDLIFFLAFGSSVFTSTSKPSVFPSYPNDLMNIFFLYISLILPPSSPARSQAVEIFLCPCVALSYMLPCFCPSPISCRPLHLPSKALTIVCFLSDGDIASLTIISSISLVCVVLHKDLLVQLQNSVNNNQMRQSTSAMEIPKSTSGFFRSDIVLRRDSFSLTSACTM